VPLSIAALTLLASPFRAAARATAYFAPMVRAAAQRTHSAGMLFRENGKAVWVTSEQADHLATVF
jgi:hypothetical protein